MRRIFLRPVLLLLLAGSMSSCYTYKLATHAQPGGDELSTTTVHARSLFWGLVNKPQVIHTAPCDALGIVGVSEVKMETSFGNVLLAFGTLGIYCPMRIVYKCSKPCAQSGEL
jgi:hypothetical protein